MLKANSTLPETVHFSRNLLKDLTRISKIDEDPLE